MNTLPSPLDRLCGCSFMHPRRTLSEGLAVVKELGFRHVDIGIGGGNRHYDPVQVAEAPQSFATLVQREIEASGLQSNECFTLNFGPPLNCPEREDRKRTRQLFAALCDFAQRAGFRSVLFVPGPVHAKLGPQASLDLAAAACAELAAIAAEHDILLNIEADCQSCARTPEAAAELCARVRGLGLTLDYSHFIYQGIAAERVRALHPYTRHVHIRQATPGRIVAEVDAGGIDYAEEIHCLEESGYNGLYCIEYLSLEKTQQAFDLSEARTRAMIPHVVSHLCELTLSL